jgi:hypothetical protein
MKRRIKGLGEKHLDRFLFSFHPVKLASYMESDSNTKPVVPHSKYYVLVAALDKETHAWKVRWNHEIPELTKEQRRQLHAEISQVAQPQQQQEKKPCFQDKQQKGSAVGISVARRTPLPVRPSRQRVVYELPARRTTIQLSWIDRVIVILLTLTLLLLVI